MILFFLCPGGSSSSRDTEITGTRITIGTRDTAVTRAATIGAATIGAATTEGGSTEGAQTRIIEAVTIRTIEAVTGVVTIN